MLTHILILAVPRTLQINITFTIIVTVYIVHGKVVLLISLFIFLFKIYNIILSINRCKHLKNKNIDNISYIFYHISTFILKHFKDIIFYLISISYF